jgi:hypothetical protein
MQQDRILWVTGTFNVQQAAPENFGRGGSRISKHDRPFQLCAQVGGTRCEPFATVRGSWPTVMIDVHESVGASAPGLKRRRKFPSVESAVVHRRLLGDRQQTGTTRVSGTVSLSRGVLGGS